MWKPSALFGTHTKIATAHSALMGTCWNFCAIMTSLRFWNVCNQWNESQMAPIPDRLVSWECAGKGDSDVMNSGLQTPAKIFFSFDNLFHVDKQIVQFRGCYFKFCFASMYSLRTCNLSRYVFTSNTNILLFVKMLKLMFFWSFLFCACIWVIHLEA